MLESLFTRYIESLIYRGLVENLACEQASRMVAMKAASDNASDLISELQLIYNKNRQTAITQEISRLSLVQQRFNIGETNGDRKSCRNYRSCD